MRHGLPDGVRVYAVGDIHGEAGMLDKLLARIEGDLADNPHDGEVIEVFLGDYVDRGPDVPGVIERLRRPSRRKRVCLLGNHEDAMIAALADGSRMAPWLSYGAAATLCAYGVDAARHRHDPRALQPMVLAVLPPEHRLFLDRLQTTHRIGPVLFVHAGIRPGVALDAQERVDLIWIRDEFLHHREPLPVHVVHGHTPAARPEATADRTNVDTGAVYGGPLTAAVIEGRQRRFLSVYR